MKLDNAIITVTRPGGALTARVMSPSEIKFQLTDSRVRAHNGYLQPAVAEFPPGPNEVKWDLRLAPVPLPASAAPPAR